MNHARVSSWWSRSSRPWPCCSISVGHGAGGKAGDAHGDDRSGAVSADRGRAKRGDSIVWINKDPFPHTVTSTGKFDSNEIQPGESWTYQVQQSGELPYICSLHPTMKATLRVK